MRSSIFIIGILFSSFAFSQENNGASVQKSFGIKGGVSIPNLQNPTTLKSDGNFGFMLAVFYSTVQKKGFGFRPELVFSRQGYHFKSNTATGNAEFDYLQLPMLSTFSIIPFLQLQFGPQASYLLNAKADSVSGVSQPPAAAKILSYYNRLDYGVAAGVETFPVKGLIAGVRYNWSFGPFEKDEQPATGPSAITGINPKSHVFHLYVGWRF